MLDRFEDWMYKVYIRDGFFTVYAILLMIEIAIIAAICGVASVIF